MARMVVLTRAEAQERARVVRVRRYAVDLDLTRGEEVFGSTTVVRFAVLEGGADTFVEVRPRELLRAELDGAALDPGALREGRLPLRGLAAGEHELRVEAVMPYSRMGEGMHRFTDPEDGCAYVYTQCCMADAPLVFACFDQPDLKAEFAVSVTAPREWTVLGNGVAARVDGEGGRWECAPTPPLSTYLMAVAAGPFHSVRTEHAGLPFGLHVRRSLGPHLEADAAELLEVTRRCFDRYHEIFDEPYPFDSYDQAFVPEFNSGAMENPGLVTFRDEFVFRSAVTDTERQTRAMVVAHEMAHMWFGDLVTLRWWDDIWLNESFAEYMGYQVLGEATHFTDTWTDFAVARKSWGYDADERPSTHPVAPDPDSVPDTAAARGAISTGSRTRRVPRRCVSWWCGWARRVSWRGSTSISRGTGSGTRRWRSSWTRWRVRRTGMCGAGRRAGCGRRVWTRWCRGWASRRPGSGTWMWSTGGSVRTGWRWGCTTGLRRTRRGWCCGSGWSGTCRVAGDG